MKLYYYLKMEKKDINKEIYFFDLKELNEINTKLYINRKEFKYFKCFLPLKEGIYEINLIIYIEMKN